MFEVTSSTVLLGAVLVLIARMTVAINTQSRLSAQRELASQTLQNAMEELAALNSGERTSQDGTRLPLAEEVTTRLASAELIADVKRESVRDAPAAQRITLRLAWQPSPNADSTSLALTAFFHSDEEVVE